MKYKIISNENPMMGLVFKGYPIVISGEKRIWNDETSGQSYPSNHCEAFLEDDEVNHLKKLKSYYPFRYVFAVVCDEKTTYWANQTRHSLNKFLKSQHNVVFLLENKVNKEN